MSIGGFACWGIPADIRSSANVMTISLIMATPYRDCLFSSCLSEGVFSKEHCRDDGFKIIIKLLSCLSGWKLNIVKVHCGDVSQVGILFDLDGKLRMCQGWRRGLVDKQGALSRFMIVCYTN